MQTGRNILPCPGCIRRGNKRNYPWRRWNRNIDEVIEVAFTGNIHLTKLVHQFKVLDIDCDCDVALRNYGPFSWRRNRYRRQSTCLNPRSRFDFSRIGLLAVMGPDVLTMEGLIQFRMPVAREMWLQVSFGKRPLEKHPVLGYSIRQSAVQRNRILKR